MVDSAADSKRKAAPTESDHVSVKTSIGNLGQKIISIESGSKNFVIHTGYFSRFATKVITSDPDGSVKIGLIVNDSDIDLLEKAINESKQIESLGIKKFLDNTLKLFKEKLYYNNII